MNWVDALVIVMVGALALIGWRAGVIGAATALGGVVVAGVVAANTYTGLAPALSGVIENKGVAQVVAFGVVFLVLLVAAMVLGRIVKRLLNILLIGWVDNAAGLVAGGFVGVLGATFLIMVMGAVPVEELGNAVEESVLGVWVVDRMTGLLALLPQEFDQVKEHLP